VTTIFYFLQNLELMEQN